MLMAYMNKIDYLGLDGKLMTLLTHLEEMSVFRAVRTVEGGESQTP